MMKRMSIEAGVTSHPKEHCVRATAVTVVTGCKTGSSIEFYHTRPSFPQKENMSNILSRFVIGEVSSLQPLAKRNCSNVQIQMQNENPSSSTAAVTSAVKQSSSSPSPSMITQSPL